MVYIKIVMTDVSVCKKWWSLDVPYFSNVIDAKVWNIHVIIMGKSYVRKRSGDGSTMPR